jgi:hypothetical protein
MIEVMFDIGYLTFERATRFDLGEKLPRARFRHGKRFRPSRWTPATGARYGGAANRASGRRSRHVESAVGRASFRRSIGQCAERSRCDSERRGGLEHVDGNESEIRMNASVPASLEKRRVRSMVRAEPARTFARVMRLDAAAHLRIREQMDRRSDLPRQRAHRDGRGEP